MMKITISLKDLKDNKGNIEISKVELRKCF